MAKKLRRAAGDVKAAYSKWIDAVTAYNSMLNDGADFGMVTVNLRSASGKPRK